MATRKKKSESLVLDMPGTTGSAKIMLPKVEKGSHLTVTTYPDGRTELLWDDEALLRDVQNALTEHEKSVKVVTTVTKVKKTKK
jgi:hypothetical protein